MKILVAGVGGIGGWLAGTLARGGADVTLHARGLTRARLLEDGLRLAGDAEEDVFRLPVWNGRETPEAFDMVVVAVKAHDVPAIAESIAPALSGKPSIMAAINGLPYWFLQGFGGPLADSQLETVDPGGVAGQLFAGCPVVGAVVHASCHAVEPGVVKVVKADRLILGDPLGNNEAFVREVASTGEAGGLSCPVVGNIREEVWAKLWGNMNMNPVSALTHLSATPILDIPETRQLVVDMMEEFDLIGQRIGLTLPMDIEQRIEVTRVLGDFRTSMLVDREAGRRLEHEGILGCVIELAQKLDEAVPASRAVYALTKGLDYWIGQQQKRA